MTTTCKLVLLGHTAVGKSSIALRFSRNQFFEFQDSTIGAAFLTQSIVVDGNSVKFEIWDTAGQERYHSLAPMYYRGAKVAIVVYDITSPVTFDSAKSWVKELRQTGAPDMIIALAGNKADIVDDRKVSREIAETYAKENDLMFMEISAKTNSSIVDLFISLAKKLPPSPSETIQESVHLQNPEDDDQNSCFC